MSSVEVQCFSLLSESPRFLIVAPYIYCFRVFLFFIAISRCTPQRNDKSTFPTRQQWRTRLTNLTTLNPFLNSLQYKHVQILQIHAHVTVTHIRLLRSQTSTQMVTMLCFFKHIGSGVRFLCIWGYVMLIFDRPTLLMFVHCCYTHISGDTIKPRNRETRQININFTNRPFPRTLCRDLAILQSDAITFSHQGSIKVQYS